MPNLDSLSVAFKPTISGSIGKNITGTAYQPISVPVALVKSGLSFTRNNANNAALGADELISSVISIAASGNTTVALNSLTDMLLQAGVSLARVKGYRVQLLSVADDSVNGTACSSVTVGNAASTPFPFILNTATTTFNLGNGEYTEWATPSAAGIVVGTAINIKLLNNDGSNAAAVQLTLLGGTT